jgi:aminopeptidase N
MERASGRDLHDFFDRWVFQTGHPVYEFSWSWIARGSKGDLQLSIKQTQSTAAFLMPLPIAVKTATGEFRKTVTPTGKDYVVRIPLDSQPTEAPVLDPDHIILKEINITPAVSGSGNPRRSVAFKGRRLSKTREG